MNEENPIPKKKKNSTKASVDKLTAKQAEDLINDVMKMHLKEITKKRNVEINALSSTIEEFLKAFILIGYDLNNSPILLINAKNQLDSDALNSALTKVFLEINSKNL